MGRYHYIFPRWSNLLLPAAVVFALTAPLYIIYMVAWGFSPLTTDVGYAPDQPIEYSHRLHAGELGIDCRYCHNTVEYGARAAIPPTQTCMGCHAQIHKDSPKLEALRKSYNTGTPVLWTRIHDLPDYAYFNHAAHVTRGVSCVECHGRVDRMDVVSQQQPLSMKWCLDCHRAPQDVVRDPKLVTDLGWSFEGNAVTDTRFANEIEYHNFWITHNNIMPSQDCSTCHR